MCARAREVGRILCSGPAAVTACRLAFRRVRRIVLERRKPRLLLRLPGLFLLRFAARALSAVLFQEPPRLTRFGPLLRCPDLLIVFSSWRVPEGLSETQGVPEARPCNEGRSPHGSVGIPEPARLPCVLNLVRVP